MPFEFTRLKIPDVLLIRAKAFPDHRGYFMEAYKRSEFVANGIAQAFVQHNCSYSVRGVLRGLHYQMHPMAQGKLVSVLRGEIYDVVVDIRDGSPTYRRWVGIQLSAEDHASVYIPIGFAHGFQALSEEAIVVYKVTEEYAPEADRGIIWNDPELAIDWPIKGAILSPKDEELPSLAEAENNFVYDAAPT